MSNIDVPAMPGLDPKEVAASGAIEASIGRLGLANGDLVQEIGWDQDAADDFRFAVEDSIGSELEGEDYSGVVDAVLLWWRDGDGDLADALMDRLATLEDGAAVIVLTPRAGSTGAVDPADVEEAAATAGLHTSTSVPAAADWIATRLASRKGTRR